MMNRKKSERCIRSYTSRLRWMDRWTHPQFDPGDHCSCPSWHKNRAPSYHVMCVVKPYHLALVSRFPSNIPNRHNVVSIKGFLLLSVLYRIHPFSAKGVIVIYISHNLQNVSSVVVTKCNTWHMSVLYQYSQRNCCKWRKRAQKTDLVKKKKKKKKNLQPGFLIFSFFRLVSAPLSISVSLYSLSPILHNIHTHTFTKHIHTVYIRPPPSQHYL